MIDEAHAAAGGLSGLGNYVAVIDAVFDDAADPGDAGQIGQAGIRRVVDVVATVDAALEYGVAVACRNYTRHTGIVAVHIAFIDAVFEKDGLG